MTTRPLKVLIFFVVLVGGFSLGIHFAKANSCVSLASGYFNASSSWSGCASTTPQPADTITINSPYTITVTSTAPTVAGVTIASGGTLADGTFLLTDTGNYIDNGTNSGSGGVTVSGATSTVGGTGNVTNTGTFTISGATSPNFSSTSTLTISGGLTMGGPVTINSGASTTVLGVVAVNGAYTITNNGQFHASSTSGITGSISTSAWVQGSNATLIFGGTGNTLMATGTLTATAAGNTVNYNGAAQTLKAVTYKNLTFSGAGTKTATGVTTISGNFLASAGTATVVFTTVGGTFTVSGGTITTGAALTVTGATTVSSGSLTQGAFTFLESGNLVVSGGTFTTGAATSTISGTTAVSAGTLSLTGNTSIFTGLITVSGTGTLSGASTAIVTTAGITNNGGAVTITGIATFSTAGATLSGSSAINIANITITNPGTLTNSNNALTLSGILTSNGTLTNSSSGVITVATTTITSPGTVINNGTSTISGAFSGTGSWTQGANANLTISDVSTLSTLNASANGNNVVYAARAGDPCISAQYYNLTIGGYASKLCALPSAVLGNLVYSDTSDWGLSTGLTVNGNLTISGGGYMTLGGAATIYGNLNIISGTLDVSYLSYPLTLHGNFTNNGRFVAENGDVILNGTSTQSLSGTMASSSAFYDLTINNNYGTHPSDCELTGFTPSVVFLAGASSTDNFIMTTGGAGIEYNSGSSYSFANTDWVGPSGQPIYFRNSAISGTWLLKVSGTQTPLAYINVSRSNATGGSVINAANITNRDCGNNTGWLFGASSTSPTAYSQVAYQWFANQNSIRPGAVLASSSASTTLATTGEAFRLRMLLAVDATNSVAGVDSFVLQFANKGNGASCSTTQYGYTNIGTSTLIAWDTNSSVLSGSLATSTLNDPTDGGRVVMEQTYQSGGAFGVTSTIPAGEDGDWDFSLIDNGSPGSIDYCFQIMFASTTPLYTYSTYPEIITTASPVPTVSGILFDNGSSTIILTSNTTTPVTVTASTTDPGGPGNILYATSTIYRTSLGQNCTSNSTNCYQIPSSSCSFSGSTSTVACTANLQYFAQSTGNTSAEFPSDSWTSAITVTATGGYTATVTSTAANVGVLTAISLSTSSINYGVVLQNTNTGTSTQIVGVQNAGNSSTTLQVSGTAFVSGAHTIATSSQHYATTTFTYGAFAGSETALSDTLTTVLGFLLPSPTSTSAVKGNLYWGDAVPSGAANGTYMATTTIVATFSSGSGGSSPSYVQGTSTGELSQNYVSLTLGSSVSQNDILAFGMYFTQFASTTLVNVTSSCVTGNLTIVDNQTSSNGVADTVQGYGIISSSGTCAVTANFSTSTTSAFLLVHEISGISTSSPLDAHAMLDNGYWTTGLPTSGNATTTVNGDYIWGIGFDVSAFGDTWTPGPGFTARLFQLEGAETEDMIQSNAGSTAATITPSGTGFLTVGMMAFKP